MVEANGTEDASADAWSKMTKYEKMEQLGLAQCSLDEAAVIMGRTRRAKHFNATEHKAYEKGRAIGLNELRKTQLGMAKKSTAMATMLGRRYLDQTEQREQNESGPIDYAAIKERHRDRVRVIVAGGNTKAD